MRDFAPGRVVPGRPLLLVCSPRAGNSLTAAFAFAEARADGRAGKSGGKAKATASVSPSGGIPGAIRPVMLHDYDMYPCRDCGRCAQAGAAFPPDNPARLCPMATRDESAPLLAALLAAPWLAIFAPIYFYHLPARLKAMLDRCQLFYNAALQKRPFMLNLPKRRAYVVLAAARERGEQLFAGSLLSLKYALAPLNMELQDPLLLYGLEPKGDLAGRADLLERVRQYGRLARELEGTPPEPEAEDFYGEYDGREPA
ncbi:MAG: NAD(P)H-dependent oxidoreductase [Deltaproteobacteria bacterium]|jgi:hypothetical protein|nr:NAD(P)H-dependent oxidoreductase [Deltaproteobacteria bacterium]